MKRFPLVLSVAGMMVACCAWNREVRADDGKPTLPTASVPQDAGVTSAEAANLYLTACGRMERGRFYLRAIAELQQASRQKPGQSEYQAALGCAYAGRVAVIAEAAYRARLLPSDRQKYAQWKQEWERAQSDQASLLFGTPRPRPPSIVTADDQQPYTLDQDAAYRQFHELMTKAFAAWEQAAKLAREPAQQSAAAFARGWGRLVLQRSFARLNSFQPAEVQSGDVKRNADAKLLDRQKATDEFTELTRRFPKEARNWQALGDSVSDKPFVTRDAAACKDAVESYRKALALNKVDVNVWFRVYALSKEAMPEQAEQALRQMAAWDGSNAFAAYRMAGLLLARTNYAEFYKALAKANADDTSQLQAAIKAGTVSAADITSGKFREKLPPTDHETGEDIAHRLIATKNLQADNANAQAAIEFLEMGNRAGSFAVPVYTPSTPRLLLSAWNLVSEHDTEDLASLLLLADMISIEGYARMAVLQHQEPQALRMLNAALGYSYRLAGDLDVGQVPIPMLEQVRKMGAITSVTATGEQLRKTYADMGDTQNATRVREELAAFQARWQNFDAAQRKAEQHVYNYR